MSSLWQPPKLRTTEGNIQEERSATWLELFYDLVFVVAVAALAHRLDQHLTWPEFGGFVLLFVAVWWAWVGSTFYANRFDTDDVLYRLLTAGEMLAVAAMAVHIEKGLIDGSTGFALAYAVLRGLLIAKYLRVRAYVPEARGLATRYIQGFGLAVLIWLISVFAPVPYRFALWVLAIVIDFITPLTVRHLQAGLALNISHLPERFGLFTIIVLGESIVAVASGLAEQSWEFRSVISVALGFFAAFSIWWVYFANIDETVIRRTRIAGQVWVYTHLLLTLSLTMAGVGVGHTVAAEVGAPLGPEVRWLICGAFALCLFSLGIIRSASEARSEAGGLPIYIFLATALALVVVAAVGTGWSALAIVITIFVACALQVAVEFYKSSQTFELEEAME